MVLRYYVQIMQYEVNVDSLFILSIGPIYSITTVIAPKGLVTPLSATSPGQASPRGGRHNPWWKSQKTKQTRAPKTQTNEDAKPKNKTMGYLWLSYTKKQKKKNKPRRSRSNLFQNDSKKSIMDTNVPLGLFFPFSQFPNSDK